MIRDHQWVTFIIPVFNQEQRLKDAVLSVLKQTYDRWKLIIINDGSTDRTCDIATHFQDIDNRIRIINLEKNSGNAFFPRLIGIQNTDTSWVAPLDADDTIDPDYLENLLLTQRNTNSRVVFPTRISETDKILPYDLSIIEKGITGKNSIKYTLNGWRINCNGGIIWRDLYLKAIENFDIKDIHSRSDELLTRYLLTLAPTISISKARYFYKKNNDSITNRRTTKLFDYLKNNQKLVDFVKSNFGITSEEYTLAQKQNFSGIFDAFNIMNKYKFKNNELSGVTQLINRCRTIVDISAIRSEINPIYILLFYSGNFITKYALRLRNIIK